MGLIETQTITDQYEVWSPGCGKQPWYLRVRPVGSVARFRCVMVAQIEARQARARQARARQASAAREESGQ